MTLYAELVREGLDEPRRVVHIERAADRARVTLDDDLILASERARFVPAVGRLGLLPEVGTSWALTRRLGYQGAFAYSAGGEQLDAQRAKDLGLVHEVVPMISCSTPPISGASALRRCPPMPWP
jgi:2-(1,2-epoxy-1,2-dihydrophenyl)acetyl-CoA isomerase